MKKTVITTAIVVVGTLMSLMVYLRLTSGNNENKLNFAEAVKGDFEISVSNTGELIPENSIDIKGPNIVLNRNFRASPVKLTDLVPEGTQVKKGDFIAMLDRSTFNNTLKDESDALNKLKSDLEMKVLDTALVLNGLRDDIRNQSFVVQEAEITLAQSKYEPPAMIRKAELQLDESQRLLTQKKKLYSLRKAQSLSEIKTLKSSLQLQSRKVDDLSDVLSGFTIIAPADGMVIYKKDRLGNKIVTGSMLNPWDMVVATLPDLSSMLSKVYVSEIEISKVKPGQKVLMTIDAFPGKLFTGTVQTIANIGEQLSNSDSKVFEVLVKLAVSDPLLRPSMTTGNKILIKTFDNVVYVPIESVHAGTDSIPFVYTKDGIRQIVLLGESNDKNIIIERGLEPGTSVWLSTPADPGKYTLAGNELTQVFKDREKARKTEAERLREAYNLLRDTNSVSEPGNTGAGSSVSAGSY